MFWRVYLCTRMCVLNCMTKRIEKHIRAGWGVCGKMCAYGTVYTCVCVCGCCGSKGVRVNRMIYTLIILFFFSPSFFPLSSPNIHFPVPPTLPPLFCLLTLFLFPSFCSLLVYPFLISPLLSLPNLPTLFHLYFFPLFPFLFSLILFTTFSFTNMTTITDLVNLMPI